MYEVGDILVDLWDPSAVGLISVYIGLFILSYSPHSLNR